MPDNPALEPANIFYKEPTESEPTKPTDEAVTEAIQEPVKDDETKAPEEAKAKAEAETEEIESENENEESQFVEIDGAEIDLIDIKKWREGHLMQSDYTKKTTALADERKTFDAERDLERETLLSQRTKVSEMTDLLKVLVSEDEGVDWAELKVDDPDRYIELKEKADKRKEALEKVESERSQPADDPALIAEEQGKLFKANPTWHDDKGKPTSVYAEETTLLGDYAAKAGFTVDEFSQLTKAHHLNTLLKAAKYDALQEKGREIKAKREKVPVVTKPKAKESTQPKNMADVFYGKT